VPVGGSCNESQIGRRIEQPMQGLPATQGGVGIPGFVDLGEGVEQAPKTPGAECLVGRVPPLIEHIGDLRGCDRLAIHRTDHEVVGFGIVHGSTLVGMNPPVEREEPVSQLSNSPCREVAQVSHGEACVLAADSDFPGECEVIANEHPGACDQACRVGLVMAVADSHHPRVVRLGSCWQGHGEDSEVAGSSVAQGVGLGRNLESRAEELGFHFAKDGAVGKREPCAGPVWCGDLEQLFAVHGFCPAVQEHSASGSLMSWWFDEIHFVVYGNGEGR
jgi:hypothetical protein